ncbi:MAG: DUF2911 domain-containing protein [Opitutus sp.]
MKPTLPTLLRLTLAGLLFTGVVHAQAAAQPAKAPQPPKISTPPASPAGTLTQRVGFTDVEISYARPGVKDRRIFGGLVPHGEVWRTGANTSTKVTFSTPVTIDGRELPAGSYALFSIPGPGEWTVIFNRVVGEWGAYSYKEENDALRVKVKPVTLSQPVETFTIDINDIRIESATLNLSWERTKVPVPFKVEVIKPVLAQIDEAMASGAALPASAYFQAAMFYFDNGLDLNKARAWVEEATKDENPRFFMLHGKARILAKLGDKAGATAAATQSIAAAEKQGGPVGAEYKRLNEALLASLK